MERLSKDVYPLSYYKYEEFPALDKVEIELICKKNAFDLVLIEDASEVLRIALQAEEVFENILKEIVSTNPDYEFVRSETFPFYLNFTTRNKYYPNMKPSSRTDKERYDDLVEEYKNSVENKINKKLVTILGVSLGEHGGHYAAFLYENGIVSIFDSMQIESKRTSRSPIKSLGFYTPFFIQLAQDIFPKSEVHVPECVKAELSAQLTGGFPSNQPLEVQKTRKKSEEEKKWLSIQSTESQNHFCFLWAIWYIHLKFIDTKFEDVMNKLFVKLDPLVVIKRYAWCIVQFLKIHIDKRFMKFFNDHFLAIWSNIPLDNKLSPNFGKYLIPQPKQCKTINDAILESVTNVGVKLTTNTPVPKGIC